MKDAQDFTLSCPIPLSEFPRVTMAHGGGGLLTHRLIEKMFLPAFANSILEQRHDGAMLSVGGAALAFTTDSYVVRPCFFPGGDIGSLAVNGTVNDLAMCGARPLYLSVAMILQEGLPMADLWRVVSSMRAAAAAAGVQLVTGDTKVVEGGRDGGGLFINTGGVGVRVGDRPVSAAAVRPGDAVLLSGDIGRHGMAVMAARGEFAFETSLQSDSAPLAEPVLALLREGIEVHCLRDPTRGGLATTLLEIAGACGLEIRIEEEAVPVCGEVRGACEILGFDPLYVANEGRFVAFVPDSDKARALRILRAYPLCRESCVIGVVAEGEGGAVISRTVIGGERALDMPGGELLPRIC